MTKLSRQTIILGALMAALAVMLGAFGAHAVAEQVSPERLDNWRTAAQYHFYHALGLVLLGILLKDRNSSRLRWAAYLFTSGILFFSGSLYALVLLEIPLLGALTPIGGVCFIVAWVLIAWDIYQNKGEG